MRILNAVLGTVSRLDPAEVAAELAPLLLEGEAVAGAFRTVRDLAVFTDRRLLLVDRQGVTGSRTTYLTVPYGDVSRFAVETAGTFELETELKLYLRGGGEPLVLSFPRGGSWREAHRLLAAGVLG